MRALPLVMLPEIAPGSPKAPPPGAQRIQEALFSGLNERDQSKSEVEVDARLTVSDQEILQKKDFAQMSAAEIAAAKEAIARLTLPLDEVRTRRLAPNRHGHIIDVRRTLRASMKAGGALIDLKYLGPRVKEPPIVALLDMRREPGRGLADRERSSMPAWAPECAPDPDEPRGFQISGARAARDARSHRNALQSL